MKHNVISQLPHEESRSCSQPCCIQPRCSRMANNITCFSCFIHKGQHPISWRIKICDALWQTCWIGHLHELIFVGDQNPAPIHKLQYINAGQATSTQANEAIVLDCTHVADAYLPCGTTCLLNACSQSKHGRYRRVLQLKQKTAEIFACAAPYQQKNCRRKKVEPPWWCTLPIIYQI